MAFIQELVAENDLKEEEVLLGKIGGRIRQLMKKISSEIEESQLLRLFVAIYKMFYPPKRKETGKEEVEKENHSVRMAHVLVIIQDALEEYLTRYGKRHDLSRHQRINAWQTCVKGAINRAIYDMVLTDEQRLLMQEMGVLDENGKYRTPELRSLDSSNELMRQIFLEIWRDYSELLMGYFDFALAEENKTELVLFTTSENRLVYRQERFYYGRKEISREEFADFVNKNASLVMNVPITYVCYAISMVHHLGSERGYRDRFLRYLKQNLWRFTPEQQQLLEKFSSINTALICPDYNPWWEPRHHIGHTAGTDNYGSGNPAADLFEFGNLRDVFQNLLRYPYGGK